MSWATPLWAVLFAFGLVVEGVALYSGIRGDTLSEHVWALRATQVGRAVLMPFWAWMTWHLWIEPRQLHSPTWWDDYVIIGLAIALALVVNYATRR